MINWFFKPIKKRLYQRYREQLVADFHKNGCDSLDRTIIGLRLITEPLWYNGEYLDLTPQGKIVTVIGSLKIARGRLEHFLSAYRLAVLSEQKNPDWMQLPDTLSLQHDKRETRWVDIYVGTSNTEKLFEELSELKLLLIELSLILEERSTERDVLFKTTRHIVRELEGLVEHYL